MMKYGITIISGKDGPVAVAYTQDMQYAAKILLCMALVLLSLGVLKGKKK